MRHQIILPGDDDFVRLLVQSLHESNGHAGREHLFSLFRQRFWVLGGRQAARHCVHRCMRCRKMLARPMSQQMAPLPSARVTIGYPFQSTGVDYIGPMCIDLGRGRRQKVWLCLFVCMRTRAVHIEVAEFLTSASFIHALVRFKNRKGHPQQIYSDNGTNFVGAEKELREWLLEWQQSGDAEREARLVGIDWHWSSPYASHTSGHVESLIRSVRRILTAISDENRIENREEMHTLVSEVERILNTRPLSPVPSEPGVPNPLTPAMLLFPQSDVITIPDGLPADAPYHHRRWRVVQHLADCFWKRFKVEYLQSLQRRMKWHQPAREPAVGDLVMVLSESRCRSDWPLAVVQEVCPSPADGLSRKAVVRVSSGKLL